MSRTVKSNRGLDWTSLGKRWLARGEGGRVIPNELEIGFERDTESNL